jgi:hypothetical protein
VILSTASAVRRGLQAAGALVAGAVVAGVRGEPLPLSGQEVSVALTGLESVPTATGRLVDAAAFPGLLIGAVALLLAAATLPAARRLGPWAAAVWATLLLTTLLAGPSDAAPLQTVAAIWATWLVAAFQPTLANVSRLVERLRETASARVPRPAAALQPSRVVIRPQRD